MALYKGSSQISGIYKGATSIDNRYKGSELVWTRGFKGVSFPSGAYLSRSSFIGQSDSSEFILSVWLRIVSGKYFQAIYSQTLGGTARGFGISIDNNSGSFSGVAQNRVRFFAFVGGTTQMDASSSAIISSLSGWFHVLASVNSVTGVGDVYINDIERLGAGGFPSGSQVFEFTPNIPWQIGVNPSVGGSGNAQAEVGELYFHIADSLDLSIEANRRKFIDADGAPVNLGSNGSLPTGTQPLIYLGGPGVRASTFHQNRGSGGDLSVSGTLSDVDGVIGVGITA